MPLTTIHILQHLHERRHDLRKSEQKVAEYVLRHPDDVIHMRIVDLATESHVSEPTIVRFCRSLGFDSFQLFKLGLAQQLARREARLPFQVSGSNRLPDIGRKLLHNTLDCLSQLQHTLDWSAVARATERLSHCQRIDFYGYGASGVVALDAHQKFFRLGVATAAYADPDMQHMSAATLNEQAAVVAISHSGRTLNLLQSVQIAQKQGACLIALCPKDSPLAVLADILLAVDVNEDQHTFTPMNSRLAQLLVLDMLATGLYLEKRPQIEAQVVSVKASLQPLKQAD